MNPSAESSSISRSSNGGAVPPEGSTIAAVATARGSGGIGIVRISGPAAVNIADQLARGQADLTPRRANLRRITDPSTGNLMDEGIVLVMRAPDSYTGEDVVELQVHGSPLLLDQLVAACCSLGAIPARPGEFTFRALRAGKLSLLQAEAVRTLVEASSVPELSLARDALYADARAPFDSVLTLVTRALACLEGPIDFPEQFAAEDENIAYADARRSIAEAHVQIVALLAEATALERMRHGIRVVIAGPPNVGKSSLMNALLKYPRVLVADTPGTTRDTVAETVTMNGRRVTLVDTAGLAETPVDGLDRLAGDRALRELERADIILLVLDAATTPTDYERTLVRQIRTLPHLIAVNKADLGPTPPDIAALAGKDATAISATEGTAIAELTAKLADLVAQVGSGQTPRRFVTDRQAAELAEADQHIVSVLASADMPIDVAACAIGEARDNLTRLLGRSGSIDELLETVFSTFCIGK
ncbi:MAG: tRNA uridine-5-carboxymethylaminomethyl(34) synthesis GTPase MnmE [Caldisericota bacterium]|nr:tRNA uridine-5-carboxymethylaminomethyl(34) synthesis GTPase MnmE [Caldisericota bacterium]